MIKKKEKPDEIIVNLNKSDPEEHPKPKKVKQKSLVKNDQTKITSHKITMFAEPKHLKTDRLLPKTDKRNNISIFMKCNINGSSIQGNVNFANLNDEAVDQFSKALGISKLNQKTPLVFDIYIPEGSLLKHWQEDTPKDEND